MCRPLYTHDVDVLPHNLISLVPPWRQSCPDRVVSNKIPRKPGKRKLSSTAIASWEHLLLYLQINRAKNMGHLITADERRIQFDKEFLAIRRVISLNETFVLFC